MCERLCDLPSSHYGARFPREQPLFQACFLPLTVLRLPPGLEAVGGEGGDHVLDGVADGVGVLVRFSGVARETLGLLLQDGT